MLVYGPGPTEAAIEPPLRLIPVARVLMPGVRWAGESDVAANRVDAAYVNGESRAWLASLSREAAKRVLASWQVTVLKARGKKLKALQAVSATVRSAHVLPTFIDGAPNMAPVMLWDLLQSDARHIHVIGVSFFVGSHTYRADHRRVNADTGIRQDAWGTAGNPFEKCGGIAIHNPSMNRRFVMNLRESSLISGDKNFEHALNLSDEQYLCELDKQFGIDRR